MADSVIVRTTAFIDDAWILYKVSGYPNAEITEFEGNNRSFTYYTENQTKLFKMAQHAVVNFKNNTVNVYSDVGPTRKRVTTNNGATVTYTEGQTHNNDMTYSYSFNSDKTVATINLRGKSSNPLVGLAPDIDWEYTVTVNKNGTVKVVGKHDGYPCHEIYKRVDSNAPVTLHTLNKQTILSLGPPMEIDVNVTN